MIDAINLLFWQDFLKFGIKCFCTFQITTKRLLDNDAGATCNSNQCKGFGNASKVFRGDRQIDNWEFKILERFSECNKSLRIFIVTDNQLYLTK